MRRVSGRGAEKHLLRADALAGLLGRAVDDCARSKAEEGSVCGETEMRIVEAVHGERGGEERVVAVPIGGVGFGI